MKQLYRRGVEDWEVTNRHEVFCFEKTVNSWLVLHCDAKLYYGHGMSGFVCLSRTKTATFDFYYKALQGRCCACKYMAHPASLADRTIDTPVSNDLWQVFRMPFARSFLPRHPDEGFRLSVCTNPANVVQMPKMPSELRLITSKNIHPPEWRDIFGEP